MHVSVNDDLCTSTRACVRSAPEVFEVRGGTTVVVIPDPGPELHETVRLAEELCLRQAITITE